MLFVSWEKIMLYFGGGESFKAVPEEFVARAMLYNTSIKILEDYAPFGSGLASFGSFASGEYYSKLYVKYSIDGVKGLMKNDYSYVADTYFPCLVQFGYIGVVLFLLFLFYLVRKSFLLLKKGRMDHSEYFIMVLLIVGYFIIESIADATFTSHRGFFMMMLLALILSEQKRTVETTVSEKNISAD
jgi:O-antigen ligase